MFADDSSLFISSHSLESLSVIANTVLKKLAKWFRLNILPLNVNKTNSRYILFHSHQKKLFTPIKLTVDNVPIEQTVKTKFLGVVLIKIWLGLITFHYFNPLDAKLISAKLL